ncbi:hypothetical protein GCM10010981_39460 [Dyella nitratireducens]|uniref:Uncharacterized protein n=1 Tax=Dyella nitratireducens TaxID=1849580 RepID=A0ABQ1GLX2_9GAMM|nr:hypothetical protein GCM10010981_39460 [Dyella nitratireducens]GLQ41448.1 hypothetical protein GCM10007902_12980 [Dyella nitratireducens]
MGNVWLTSLPRQQSFVWGHKRIGWIVFVVLLTGFIPAGAYRAIYHEEARLHTAHAVLLLIASYQCSSRSLWLCSACG